MVILYDHARKAVDVGALRGTYPVRMGDGKQAVNLRMKILGLVAIRERLFPKT